MQLYMDISDMVDELEKRYYDVCIDTSRLPSIHLNVSDWETT